MNTPRIPRGTIDFETRSFLDVRNVGAWPYAEHESTEILCLSSRLPRTEPNLWVPGMGHPENLLNYIEQNGLCEAHNAQFERAIWLRIMLEKMGYPIPKRWMDTMAVCAYKALPLGLDAVGEVLNLNIKKDKRGKYLLDKLSKPRKPTKKDPRIWIDDWDLYDELYDYCDRDTETEEELSITIGDLPPAEYKLWMLDQKINQRGVYLDMEAIKAAKVVCEQIEVKWNAELAGVTGGAVTKGTQVARIKKWCDEQGVVIDSLGKDILKDMLKDDEKREFLPPQVRRALQIRLELGMASTAKINKFLETVCKDGKVRGMLQYHGAGTGRWAGRGAQPQNFPRGITKPKDYVHHLLGTTSLTYGTIDENDYDAARSEELIADIKLMDSDYLEIKYGTAMGAVSSALRGMMTASPGNRLMVADFSAIEAVVLAWVCGEESKLDVFRNKLDPYCETASGIFGFKVDKKIAKDPSHPEFKKHSDARQTGKTCELAFGYQGGVGAWRNFDRTESKTDDEINETKDTWRANHPNIQDAWYGFERAALNAVSTGKPHHYNGITFGTMTDKAGNWMYIQLPNGRKLWYYDPELHDDETPWGKPCKKLSYQGKDNNRGGAWGRVETYGGKLTENIVQAIARDLMVEGMIQVEILGYRIILTVHDEIIADVPFGFGSQKEFEEAMAYVPPWAKGCPVAVDGWTGHRYRK